MNFKPSEYKRADIVRWTVEHGIIQMEDAARILQETQHFIESEGRPLQDVAEVVVIGTRYGLIVPRVENGLKVLVKLFGDPKFKTFDPANIRESGLVYALGSLPILEQRTAVGSLDPIALALCCRRKLEGDPL